LCLYFLKKLSVYINKKYFFYFFTSYHCKYLGVSKSVPLIPHGDQHIVNESNKRDYVKLLCNYKMIQEIAPQTQSLVKGIKLGLTAKYFGILDWRQLGLHLAGKSKIDGKKRNFLIYYTGI
jgi:hypothetical protein